MEPIDRIKARAAAFEELGLAQRAGSDEVRAAWRSIAFRAHPDQQNGDSSEFTRAKKAYDFLRAEGLAGKDYDDEASATPRRPTVQSRVTNLNDDDTSACRG
ncbi:MAG: DnaJ domain-containing protein, partial [Ruegeria sp.]